MVTLRGEGKGDCGGSGWGRGSNSGGGGRNLWW